MEFFTILVNLEKIVDSRLFPDTEQIKATVLEFTEALEKDFVDSKRSSSLTDKLLRFLSLISIGLPDEIPCDLSTPEAVMEQINDLLRNLLSPEAILQNP